MPLLTVEPAATAPARAGRREDEPFLRGVGRFVGDLRFAGLLHLAVVRSPLASGELGRVDVSAARVLTGVVDAFSAAELDRVPGRIPSRLPIPPALAERLQPPLAAGRVHYQGQPVAAVVAVTPELAQDAAELVTLELGDRERREPELVHVHEDAFGDVGSACAHAAIVVRERFSVARQGGMPLEPRGTVAAYDSAARRLTLWMAAKAPNHARAAVAEILGLDPASVALRPIDLGGGFGVRGELHPEDVLVALAAVRTGRPVRWLETRVEHLQAAYQARGQDWEATIAVSADGTILALEAAVRSDIGAFVGPNGITVGLVASKAFLGPYRTAAYRCRVEHVVTSKVPLGTMRGPSYVEAVLARERLVDRAAADLGLDPVELRHRNLVLPSQMPYPTGLPGVELDGGDYAEALERALATLPPRPAGRSGSRAVGVACSVEASGTPVPETARVRVESDGTVVAEVASASFGQGHETTLTGVVADALGLSRDWVVLTEGATEWDGGGTFASRTAMMAGSACHAAALSLRTRILERAADILGHPVTMTASAVAGSDGSTVDLAALAPLEATATFHPEAPTFTYGAGAARVDIDRETGEVRLLDLVVAVDAGRALDIDVVRGQLLGAAMHGVGAALHERIDHDDDGGLLTGGLRDYHLPTALDCAALTAVVLELAPSLRNPLGVRGVGEIGVSLAAAAIANAVAAATGGTAPVNRLPIHPGDLAVPSGPVW